jgi:alkanesulfonate monooxygenase
VEYGTVVRRLTDGETVTFEGDFCRVQDLSLFPRVPPELRPGFMVSGSSPAGRQAAALLGARPVTYALPDDSAKEAVPDGVGSPGVRLGIIARDTADEAWKLAHLRFPPDRAGSIARALARSVSDSHWHERLCRLAEERATEDTPYWLVPFERYKTMCPYLVGSHDQVATELARYLALGCRTFLLDIPSTEQDLVHARTAFTLASSVGAGAP